MKTDVLVLGGGIIGATCAYELAKNGANVILIEQNQFGSGASGNSAAMLEFQLDAHRGEPFYSLAKASHDLFPSLYEEIRSLTGIDFQFERCGILQLAMTPAEATDLQHQSEHQRQLGLKIQWFPASDVNKRFPGIEIKHYGAVLYEEDGQVNGEKFVSALTQAARKKGALLMDQMGPVTFLKKEGMITGVRAQATDFLAPTIVVATGAWTDRLLVQLNVKLGIEPIRGQLIVYDTPKQPVSIPVYCHRGGYITPKRDGYTLGGTTVESVGFDNSTTDEGKKSISEKVTSLMPLFTQYAIRGMTAGLRPKSNDELPVIGALPANPNVYVAAGHYRNGVLLAPITAQLISCLILKSKCPIDPSPFSPSRFVPA